MIEPVSLTLIITWIAHHLTLAAVVLYSMAITVEILEGWISDQSKIYGNDSDVIAVELANRLANKNYIEMPGVFRQEPTNTRMVQAIYNKRTREILNSRRIASPTSPNQNVINVHTAGGGMVVYT